MTRHQRRKASRERKLAKANALIVRWNLSTPRSEDVHVRGQLISPVYGNSMDRARGRGTTPIHPLVERVIKRELVNWNPY